MNADKIDVLAVMLQSADALKYAGARRAGIDSVLEARAAVAELIAADEEYDKASDAFDAAINTEASTECWNRLTRAKKRRAAALARVQGGAA